MYLNDGPHIKGNISPGGLHDRPYDPILYDRCYLLVRMCGPGLLSPSSTLQVSMFSNVSARKHLLEKQFFQVLEIQHLA